GAQAPLGILAVQAAKRPYGLRLARGARTSVIRFISEQRAMRACSASAAARRSLPKERKLLWGSWRCKPPKDLMDFASQEAQGHR
ncbi:MAG: hypothetical protein ILA17_11770, partial [Ruminococcus sp.]|nr:hypothetical protein [Ruminococcus sp.]